MTSIEGTEVFTAQEFDSFDEAKIAVDKGIRDRKIELAQLHPETQHLGGVGTAPRAYTPPADEGNKVNVPGKGSTSGYPSPENTAHAVGSNSAPEGTNQTA